MIRRGYNDIGNGVHETTRPLNSISKNDLQETLSDGSSYIGPTVNGQRHGQGILCFGNKSCYKGEFKHGKFDGYGVLFVDGHETYRGEFKNGKSNGYGTLKHTDGSIYRGLFKDGKSDGYGTLKHTDGSIYKGLFKDGKQHGSGVCIFSDCNVYDGHWENGQPHGHGVRTYDHNIKYQGYFSNGHPNGRGTMTYPDGTTYIGGFIDGKKNGVGQFRYKNGNVMEGQFKNDILDSLPNQINLPKQSLSTITTKDAESIYSTTTESSIADFNAAFNPIETLTFTGKKIKQQHFTIHVLNVFNHGKTETAFLIKPSSQCGRKNKVSNHHGLGYGAFKFAQKAVMVLPNTQPIKFALTTQEYTNEIPDEIQSELDIEQRLRQLPHLHSAVVLPKYIKTTGKLHGSHSAKLLPGGQKLNETGNKILGIMPICNDASQLFKYGTVSQKKIFIDGLLNTLQTLGRNNVIHNDIKPQNMDWKGRSIDNGSMKFNPSDDDCDDYGTPSYHCLFQQSPFRSKLFSKELKQRQDSFAVAATIYEVLTNQRLDLNYATGHFYQRADGTNYYKLNALTIYQFRQKIYDIRTKINAAPFPFDKSYTQQLKIKLLNMTGTNETGPFCNGNNHH